MGGMQGGGTAGEKGQVPMHTGYEGLKLQLLVLRVLQSTEVKLRQEKMINLGYIQCNFANCIVVRMLAVCCALISVSLRSCLVMSQQNASRVIIT